jgi:hypothetical protein
MIEGKGVSPSVPVGLPPEQLLAGDDAQMQVSLALATSI